MRPDLKSLSRREREIMEVLWRLGAATVAEVHAELASPPTPAAIRSALWLLEEKGHVEHEQHGPRNVYRARVAAEKIRGTAVTEMIRTFFEGSPGGAVRAILGDPSAKLDDAEIARIEALLRRHKRGRKP
jgi:predicted transcriptional regulator